MKLSKQIKQLFTFNKYRYKAEVVAYFAKSGDEKFRATIHSWSKLILMWKCYRIVRWDTDEYDSAMLEEELKYQMEIV